MRTARIVLRGLRHYWRSNLAVAFGVAIATAVVTGSLIIGDSVKGSIRVSALSRLGRIDQALVTQSYFRSGLADELQKNVAPLILTQGSAGNDDTGETVPNVTVVGVDRRFARFWPSGFPEFGPGQGAVSKSLAKDLSLKSDANVVLTVGKPGLAPSDSLFAGRKRADMAATLRIAQIQALPDGGAGGFGLDAATTTRRSVFVDREWLANALGKAGKANAMLAGGVADLNRALTGHFSLEDAGLQLTSRSGGCDLSSDRLVLTEDQVAAATTAGIPAHRGSIYLATRLKAAKQAEYAVFGAIDGPESADLDPGGIAINQWLAQDLVAKQGGKVDAEFLLPRRDGTYGTQKRTFTVRRLTPTAAADPSLAPNIEGVTNAKRIGDWDPPFPVDLSRITPRDEEYWDRYRAAPKAFVSMDAMKALWSDGGDTDWITSVRFDEPAAVVRKALTERLSPTAAGFRFRPVRKLALEAAEGSTDFAGLFLGLGCFVILSAAGLASSLMRLAVERRAPQWGVMQACGLTSKQVMAVALLEGLAVSVIGACVGGLLGIAYAAAIVGALTKWWIGAIGTAPLSLHVDWSTVCVGGVIGLIVGFASVAVGMWSVLKRPVLSLIAGSRAGSGIPAPRSPWRVAAFGFVVVAAVALGVGVSVRAVPAETGFLGVGFACLAATLLGCDLAASRLRKTGRLSLTSLASRNASQNKRHSLLVVGLLACASFTLVAVAPNARTIRLQAFSFFRLPGAF